MKIIKHLVLSGGGAIGLVQYGTLKYLTNKNIINRNTIESIYATSIGCITAFVYMLNFDWTWIDDFFISERVREREREITRDRESDLTLIPGPCM